MVKQRDLLKVGGKGNSIVAALMKQTVQWGDLFERVTLKSGEELYSAGMRSPFVYAPIDAVVSQVTSPTGNKDNEVTLSVLGAGDLVGVSQLLGDAPNAAGAICDMGGFALRCSAQAARRLLDTHEDSRHVVNAYANLATAESWQWLAASVQLPVITRVAAYLLIHWQTSGSDALPVTHIMMSRRMAIRRPSITEALAELHTMGIMVQRERGRLDIKSPEKLAALVREKWPLYGTHRQAFRNELELDLAEA